MPKFLALYKLKPANPDPNVEFMRQAEERGWVTWVYGADNNYHELPGTTIDGSFSDFPAAHASFQSIISATKSRGHRVVLENCIVLEYTNYTFDLALK